MCSWAVSEEKECQLRFKRTENLKQKAWSFAQTLWKRRDRCIVFLFSKSFRKYHKAERNRERRTQIKQKKLGCT